MCVRNGDAWCKHILVAPFFSVSYEFKNEQNGKKRRKKRKKNENNNNHSMSSLQALTITHIYICVLNEIIVCARTHFSPSLSPTPLLPFPLSHFLYLCVHIHIHTCLFFLLAANFIHSFTHSLIHFVFR